MNTLTTNEEKKTWLLKNWKLLDGKTLSKALHRYWSPETKMDIGQKAPILTTQPLDLYTEAVKIFK
jgi:hypothetical protein